MSKIIMLVTLNKKKFKVQFDFPKRHKRFNMKKRNTRYGISSKYIRNI